MTGAGAGSIGAEVLQGLLSGGARVVVTTSRFSREVTEYYQAMYTKYGSRGSQLIVVPFNQGKSELLCFQSAMMCVLNINFMIQAVSKIVRLS